MPNDVLLHRTLARIEANPADWDQDHWDTCFASHACREAGLRVPHRVPLLVFAWDWRRPWALPSVYAAARRVLDIDDVEAARLFDGNNTLDTLRARVHEIAPSIKLP